MCGASQEIKAKDGRSALDLDSNDETRAMFREEDTQLVCLSVCQSTFRSSKEFLRAAFIKKNRHNKCFGSERGFFWGSSMGFFRGFLGGSWGVLGGV